MGYEPILPEGMHFGEVRQGEGDKSSLVFDENNVLQGPANLKWVDDDSGSEHPVDPLFGDGSANATRQSSDAREEMETSDLLAQLLVLGAVLVATQAAPHVLAWWRKSAWPMIRTRWSGLRVRFRRKGNDTKRAHAGAGTERIAPAQAKSTSVTGPLVGIADDPGLTMTLTEWHDRMRMLVAAEAVTEAQRTILTNAHVVLDTETARSIGGEQQLSPLEFHERLRRALDASPEVLEPTTARSLAEALGVQLGIESPRLEREIEA